ncbi:zf-RVT domain-containing protein [Cephalotus follicularis]|uniref:Zf-RVT domain-containing protein n=1 Tax=Cephalotus follicularis TaxID=3775 RepID=A0A1Q3DKB3_CEPFO|nr:zf-RVT domain-containing protein [Cephalotus follicularis]
MKALDRFKVVSGLTVNTNKSHIYFCNTMRRTRCDILRSVNFKEGTLPVTYLGLPLITKRLTRAGCAPLIDRIMARVNSWTSKALSFAGRLQLIKSTLVNMQVFWCSVFFLPGSVIKECVRMLRTFLWGQSKGKVKWADVCKPLKEGGLGVKDLRLWNKALLLKQVWNILKNQSLWANWCHAHLMRHTNFWELPVRGPLSWSWRQMLRLRMLAKEHILYVCGNGERFSLWYDPWLHGQSVHALYGHRVIYDSGLGCHARVKEVIWQGAWCWPTVSVDLLDIQQRVQVIPISTEQDRIYWGTRGQDFSTANAWQVIRTPSTEVSWHAIVWHPMRIPKHAFCLWLTLRGAHKTMDKLMAVGVLQSDLCVFNCGDRESMAHLFFLCPFSASIWTEVLRKCNVNRTELQWDEAVAWMIRNSKGDKFPATLRKLAFAATVYHIWLERNRRCFKNCYLPM